MYDMPSPPYQDWQKYIVPSADVILSESKGPLNLYTGPIVDCSAWSHILLSLHNIDTLAHLKCDLTWRGYNATLFAQNVNYFVAGPGDFVNMVLPTHGRQVGIEYLFLDNAPTAGLAYALMGMNHPMSKYEAAIQTIPLFAQVLNPGANASQLVNMSYWYEGPVLVTSGSQNGTPGFVSFQMFDYGTASWVEFVTTPILASNTANPVKIHFPPAPVRANVNNNGAAQLIGFEVIPISS